MYDEAILEKLEASRALLVGNSFSASVNFTRPSNTTDYTAGDAVGRADVSVAANAGLAALEFVNAAPAGGGNVLIQSVALKCDVASVPSGMGNMRLHLYSVTPPSALLDNAAWDLPAGDRASYLGYVDIGTPVDLGSTLWVEANQVGKMVKATSSSLFGYLQTIGGFTPSSAAVKKITLNTIAV